MQYLGLPEDIMGLLVRLLSGLVRMCDDNGVKPHVASAPKSGLRHRILYLLHFLLC